MTKTQPPETANEPTRKRGLAWTIGALATLLAAAAGFYFAFVYEPDTVVEATPPTAAPDPTPTTAAPEVEAPPDLEIIEEGVAAFYDGDGQRAGELFELSDRTDDQIRDEAAYQAAVGGQLAVSCTEQGTLGVFTCRVPYHNAMTEALNFTDHGDTNRVVVEDGVITEFEFPEHSWLVNQMGTFLALEGRFEGYGGCGFGPFPESCAVIQMENLDAYVDWRSSQPDPASIVGVTLESWYGTECEQAIFLSASEFLDEYSADDCALAGDQSSSSPIQMMAYENILGAEASVEACEVLTSGDLTVLSCEVHYSNKMNQSVGKPPAVTVREFGVMIDALVTGPDGEQPWYRDNYPEDTELRESFQRFAEAGDLRGDYQDAGCSTNRTEVCAQLIEDNLEDWAAWYQTNG